jgi:hypothetical protein
LKCVGDLWSHAFPGYDFENGSHPRSATTFRVVGTLLIAADLPDLLATTLADGAESQATRDEPVETSRHE